VLQTGKHDMSQSDTVAEKVILTIPIIMRMVTADMRRQQTQLVPAQLGVLGALAQYASCNLSELAEHSGVSLSTMSGTISHMVGQGWVKRTPDPRDRRMILLELTPDGRVLLTEMVQLIVSHISDLLAPLSAAELTAIENGLVTLQKVFPPLEPLPRE
jgi:DNA-binding MarR family transcriptional regulator